MNAMLSKKSPVACPTKKHGTTVCKATKHDACSRNAALPLGAQSLAACAARTLALTALTASLVTGPIDVAHAESSRPGLGYVNWQETDGSSSSRGGTFIGDQGDVPVYVQLAGLGLVNVAGFAAVIAAIRKLQDRSEPLSLVKIQLGLMTDGCELHKKLDALNKTLKMEQQGLWLTLEEAIIELQNYSGVCSYADVDVNTLTSKSEMYELFKNKANSEVDRAIREDALAVQGEGCEFPPESIMDKIFYKPRKAPDSGMVVTLLAAVKGRIDVPEKVNSWSDVRQVMLKLSDRSSTSLMGLELLWTPEEEGDYLTKDQLVKDYPNLRTIN